MQDKDKLNEAANRAFMDALTASDEMHRKAMRGMAPEVSVKLLREYYDLTQKQAVQALHLRDVEGMSEEDAVASVLR